MCSVPLLKEGKRARRRRAVQSESLLIALAQPAAAQVAKAAMGAVLKEQGVAVVGSAAGLALMQVEEVVHPIRLLLSLPTKTVRIHRTDMLFSLLSTTPVRSLLLLRLWYLLPRRPLHHPRAAPHAGPHARQLRCHRASQVHLPPVNRRDSPSDSPQGSHSLSPQRNHLGSQVHSRLDSRQNNLVHSLPGSRPINQVRSLRDNRPANPVHSLLGNH